ncbi:MAG TPA: hypothetical protein VHB79_13940 [Polyangiaceae bacterium]|nr:hypothetical protein [Polyangiaceae bacterium]
MRAWLCAAALALACGAERGPNFATSERFPDAPRRPPTFAAEPVVTADELTPTEGPTPTLVNGAEPRRLSSPLDSDAARDLVSRFFMAVLGESTHELFQMFATQAWVLSEGSRQSAQAVWRTRFAQLDYGTLAGRLVAPPQTLRTYTFAAAERAKRDGVPVPQTPNEVVVVARPTLSWTGKTRLFGDQLAFRLRPKADEPGFEIAEIAEDFRLP